MIGALKSTLVLMGVKRKGAQPPRAPAQALALQARIVWTVLTDRTTRWLRLASLQSHRLETFKLPSDPMFVKKVRDIVGLYSPSSDDAVRGQEGSDPDFCITKAVTSTSSR